MMHTTVSIYSGAYFAKVSANPFCTRPLEDGEVIILFDSVYTILRSAKMKKRSTTQLFTAGMEQASASPENEV